MAPSPDPPPTAPAADEALPAPRRGFVAAGWAKFSDNAIPTLIVAVIAGLVMFSFNETSGRITRLEDRIDRLEAGIDTRFTRLEANQQQIAVTLGTLIGEFTAFQQDVDHRFDAVATRFDAVDARFDAVDARFDAVDARFDSIEARLTRLEENQQQVAVTLARLVALLEAGGEAGANLPG